MPHINSKQMMIVLLRTNKDTLDQLPHPFTLSPSSNKTNLHSVEKGEVNKNTSLEVEGCLNNGDTDISIASKSGVSNLLGDMNGNTDINNVSNSSEVSNYKNNSVLKDVSQASNSHKI